MPSDAVQRFLEQGERSGLFSAAATQQVVAEVTADKSLAAEEVAARLVEKTVLTRFQADLLLAGQGDECQIAARYRLLEKLGEGGMGAVYKAHDRQLDRLVAVKVLPAKSLCDSDAIARFQREARALARLSHPNIIQAFDNGEDKGRHFLVMEYVEGASLAAILREQGSIPPTQAADLVHQAALGLQHAHEQSLVHRDLKPANLLLALARHSSQRPPANAKDQVRPEVEGTANYVAPPLLGKGVVKILDLGLARFLQDQLGDSQLTQEGIGVGTPDYMAPEQFRDALHADARTDIYGLGCTLYHLISGTVPFPGSSFSEKAQSHAKKEPLPLEERCGEVPAGLALVVSKMMAKHPADRFQTAGEVAEALAPYVAGASHSMIMLRQTVRFHAGQLTVRDPSPHRRMLPWAGWVLAALCLASLLGFLAWPSLFLGRSGEAPLASPTPGVSPVPGAAPVPPTPEPAKPKVVNIENGLTVAQDGTGQYKTIGEALENVKPGQTIRVLDAAVYPELIRLAQASRFGNITIESPQAATLSVTDDNNIIVVIDVPGVTIRGFKIRGKGQKASIAVVGKSPGTVLQELQINSGFGMVLLGIVASDKEPPVRIQDCKLQIRGEQGIRISGIADDMRNPRMCSRIAVRGNEVQGARYGVVIHGQAQQVQIVGNRIYGSETSGLGLVNLLPGTQNILIANNSLWENHRALTLFGDATKEIPREAILVTNNLVAKSQSRDFAYFDGIDPDDVKGEGDGASLPAIWLFSHNWREGRTPGPSDELRQAWIPPSSTDVLSEQIALLSEEPQNSNFLRPAKGSPLATGGIGGNLPDYVGAFPPEGAVPWDWKKTWDAGERNAISKVVTIENGLTVAQDGTGQFKTVGAALAKVKPKQTIRILDDAVYHERVHLRSREDYEGLTLEAPRGATLEFPTEATIGVLIVNVPRVTVRGLHIRTKTAGTSCVGVAGLCPGTLLADLTCSSDLTPSTTGITLDDINLSPEDEPTRVEHCAFARLGNGISLHGMNLATKTNTPSRRVLIRENRFEECIVGMWLQGQFNDLQIVGNRFWRSSEAGLRLTNLQKGSDRILFANNTLKGARHCIEVTDVPLGVKEVEIRNNITIADASPDIRCTPGAKALPATWRIANNWRQVKRPRDGSQEAEQLLDSKEDKFVDDLPLASLTLKDASFLRPIAGSPLATSGAGSDLPTYVGAVPPEGIEHWDWQKTWEARGRNSGPPDEPSGKD